jgi:NAD(P)-dependent dehydrogenase (short-subunit alcohol dehydrogenase family)
MNGGTTMQNINGYALITGGSSGMGRAIGVALAKAGVTVVLTGRNRMQLEEVAGLVSSAGGKAEVIAADLRSQANLIHLEKEVRKLTSELRVLVHAAGVWHDESKVFAGVPLVDTPEDQIRNVLEVGIVAPMVLTRSLLPLMIPHKRGKILSISGTFSAGGAGWLHYYVSKLALEHFTVGLAQELRQHEIQVNCISPSDTDTEALRRFFPDDAATAIKPEEIGKLAVFLCSNNADHITGQSIVVKNKHSH